eukprot:2340797-Amphidinium_carterae.1
MPINMRDASEEILNHRREKVERAAHPTLHTPRFFLHPWCGTSSNARRMAYTAADPVQDFCYDCLQFEQAKEAQDLSGTTRIEVMVMASQGLAWELPATGKDHAARSVQRDPQEAK